MTIIRAAEPHSPFGTSHVIGMEGLLHSLSIAEASIGRDPYGTIAVIHDGEQFTTPIMDVRVPMTGHPNGWPHVDLTFSLDRLPLSPVAHWVDDDPTLEVIALARDALTGIPPDGASPSLDEADGIVLGLAWTILDRDRAAQVMIRRGTPWSRPRILVCHDGTTDHRFGWFEQPLADPAVRALAAMRQGTNVMPSGQEGKFHPCEFRVRLGGDDAMDRLRRIGAWTEFERSAS
jgi:hypothetical protein